MTYMKSRIKMAQQQGLPYDRALAALRQFCCNRDKLFAKSDYFDAVTSHWLQNLETKPALLPYSLWHDGKLAKIILAASAAAVDNCVRDSDVQLKLDFADIPYPPPPTPAFTFIDLFAGIGGFRIAMQAHGGKCVFSCEWNKYSQETYCANFGETPYGDIRKIKANDIPDHTVLCAGFPCQPFSLAGVSKKNSLGQKHGFEDETQGTLFFELARIIKEKRPPAFFLENVKNLLRHDKGATFEVIRRTLEDELGYVVRWELVDGSQWLPQHRERIFIVGYDPGQVAITKNEINIPQSPPRGYSRIELSTIVKPEVAPAYTLGPGTWATLERHKKHHASAGNGFGYGLHMWPIAQGAITRTISARYHKDGAEILIEQKGKLPRMLTVEEAAQIQGFKVPPYRFPVSRSQAYRQIGNSVVVPAVESTAQQIAKILTDRLK